MDNDLDQALKLLKEWFETAQCMMCGSDPENPFDLYSENSSTDKTIRFLEKHGIKPETFTLKKIR